VIQVYASVPICKVTKYADWQEFLLHKTSNVPVHVLLRDSGNDITEAITRLCVDPEVYAVYIYPNVVDISSEYLLNCDTPVFIAADEAEAKELAVRLASGDMNVLDKAINGDDMLYRFLGAHPT
jgi:hypothetical protein